MADTLSTPNYNNNPASAGGIVSSDPGTIAKTIAAMNQQVVANASPVAKATEIARQSGQITPQQAESVKTAAFQAQPATPLVVSNANAATQDLKAKQDFANGLTQGMAEQSANKANASNQPAQPEAPASPSDVADSLMEQYGGQPKPETPKTNKPKTYEEQLQDLNDKSDSAFKSYNDSMDQLKNGTFPLTADQQAQIDATKATFERMVAAQKIANQNYTGGITQAGISSGRARYAPELAMGQISSSISAGLSKISDIESKAQESLAKLKQGFDDRNYKLINDQYDKLNGYLKDKSDTITGIMKAVQEHEDKLKELNQKAEQDHFNNVMKMSEFDAKQKQDAFNNIMTSDKFDYEQKQDAIKNAMDSDKFTWQQKQDMIKNALEQGKFNYQQQNDLRNYQLDLQKAESADTPTSFKEYTLAKNGGFTGSYNSFLNSKSGKAPTQDQSTAANLVTNMKQGNDTIAILQQGGMNKISAAEFIAQANQPNWSPLKSPEMKRYQQAAQAFVEGWLRKTSGAAISDGEWNRAFEQFLPQAGDPQSLLDQKARARQGVMNGLANEAGTALSDEAKASIMSGKPTYFSLDDYVSANPASRDQINKIGTDHPNWSEDEILQVLQAPDTGSGFNQPLSTGEKGLGNLSQQFESSGNPGAIGYDSTGGLSYGKYQLAHNNAQQFVNQSPYASEFKGIPFNSQAFQDKWKEIAQKDPEGFGQAQQDYIEKTHLEPQLEKLDKMGLHVDNYSPVLKDVIFSTAVQHGPGNDVITKALNVLGPNPDEGALIKQIYKERWGNGARFASSTPAVRRAVFNRFFGPKGEMNTALAELNQMA